MNKVLRQMALASRLDPQRMGNPSGAVHPETALEYQIVSAGLQNAISSREAVAAAKLAGSIHPEDIDEQLAAWL
jgi:hypothetical protein